MAKMGQNLIISQINKIILAYGQRNRYTLSMDRLNDNTNGGMNKMNRTKSASEIKEEIIHGFGVSYWVKNALEQLEKRDAVNALNDVTVLRLWAKKRFEESISINQ